MKQLSFIMLALLMIAPAAAAEYYEGKAECPPDELCTTSPPPDRANSEGCEYCRGNVSEEEDDYREKEPQSLEPNEPCTSNICESSGPVTCMDGADEGEECHPDYQYLTPDSGAEGSDGSGEPTVTSHAGAPGVDDSSSDSAARNVPGTGVFAAIGVLGVLGVIALRRM